MIYAFSSNPQRILGRTWDILERLNRKASVEGIELYLVGGAVRDMILRDIGGGEGSINDLDLSMPIRPMSFAHDFAAEMGGAFVLLDEEFPTARVVIGGDLILDFSQFRAPSLEEDLAMRDLTINALAVKLGDLLSGNEIELIDPKGGYQDMLNGIIRFCSERSVRDDPLRLLRVYRFAAALDFKIAPESRAIVRRYVHLISESAPERIRDDLFKLLRSPISYTWVKAMDEDGLLEEIIPEIEPMKGVEQNRFHHLDVWGHTLLAYRIFEEKPIPEPFEEFRDRVEGYLKCELAHDVSRAELIKLAVLLHDIGKPETRSVDEEGQVHFYGHDRLGANMARRICNRLRISRRGTALVELLVKNHLGLMHLGKDYPPTDRALYRFLRRLGEDWIGEVMLSMADLEASQGPGRSEEDPRMTGEIVRRLAHLYYVEIPNRMSQRRIVTGDDLIRELNLSPGPIIGKLLRAIEEAQNIGQITTKEEALELAGRLLRES
jgi:putative nucleotidyltransferase with HDIG domain